eukprot:COSAG01_NODE_14616_length_1431_cov_2.454955_2_plen_269_part_00
MNCVLAQAWERRTRARMQDLADGEQRTRPTHTRSLGRPAEGSAQLIGSSSDRAAAACLPAQGSRGRSGCTRGRRALPLPGVCACSLQPNPRSRPCRSVRMRCGACTPRLSGDVAARWRRRAGGESWRGGRRRRSWRRCAQVGQSGYPLSRCGRSSSSHASGCDTHRDSMRSPPRRGGEAAACGALGRAAAREGGGGGGGGAEGGAAGRRGGCGAGAAGTGCGEPHTCVVDVCVRVLLVPAACVRVRVGTMGSQKCRIVGESQPVLIIE